MTPERWERIEAIFTRAAELSQADRAAFLDAECAGDEELRAEVESLLASNESDGGVLDATPAWLRDDAPALPEPIGPWRPVRSLGRGGMGEVWLAERNEGDVRQTVALKVIRRGLDTDDLIARFRNERRILARLDHPNIARLFDLGATADGRPYLVMEHVDGVPLLAFCDSQRLGVPQRLRLFRTICAAVHHAHRSLVVHRDIKPGNILVTPDGVPKLLDFGIAKLLDAEEGTPPLTRTHVRVLTPEYCAPEQVRGDAVTTSCDVYALGILLYELVSGRHPYGEARARGPALERLVLEVEPPPPSSVADASLRRALQGDLDTIVLKALRKEPEERYASALGLSEDIERHLGGHPVHARPATLRYRARKFIARNRVGAGAAAALVLVLTGATSVTWYQSGRIRAESARVVRERDKALEVRGFLLEMFGTTGPDQPTGDAVTARQLLDRRAAMLDASFDGDAEMRAEMLEVLAEGYEKLGLLDQAEPLARHALAARRDPAVAASPDLVHSLNLLGWIQRERGMLDESEALLEEAVSLGRAVFPPEGDARLARALNDLGALRDTRGELDDAVALYRESLDMRRRVLGEDHIGVAITTSNLSVALYRSGRNADAVREGQAALERFRRIVGPDHQRTMIVQTNLAAFQAADADHEGAAAQHRDLMERRRRLFGPDHPTVANSMVMLANELIFMNRGVEAEPILEDAVGILRAAQGVRPGDIASALRVLGGVRVSLGRPADGLADYLEAIDVLRRTTGEDVTEAFVLHGRAAAAYEALGRPEDSERAHRRALEIADRVVGPAHGWAVETRIAFAAFLRRRGRAAEADAEYAIIERALDDAGVAQDAPLRQRVRQARES